MLTPWPGNVSYECPSIHAYVSIPAGVGCKNHTPGFAAAAGTKEAHELCLAASKGMAVVGWNVLADDDFAAKVKRDFEDDKKARGQHVTLRPTDRTTGYC